jgi:hypothetical protein
MTLTAVIVIIAASMLAIGGGPSMAGDLCTNGRQCIDKPVIELQASAPPGVVSGGGARLQRLPDRSLGDRQRTLFFRDDKGNMRPLEVAKAPTDTDRQVVTRTPEKTDPSSPFWGRVKGWATSVWRSVSR